MNTASTVYPNPLYVAIAWSLVAVAVITAVVAWRWLSRRFVHAGIRRRVIAAFLALASLCVIVYTGLGTGATLPPRTPGAATSISTALSMLTVWAVPLVAALALLGLAIAVLIVGTRKNADVT